MSLLSFASTEAVQLALLILGFTILPRLVAGFALTQLIGMLFIYLHNSRLVLEIRYFGVKDEFSFRALFYHVLIILGIEGCLALTSFVFMDNAPTWVVASGLAVSMALVLLFIIERKTYENVRVYVDYDRHLYSDNITKLK